MASESRALAPLDEVKGALQRMTPSFKAALPPHIPVERFVRIVQTAVTQQQDLLNCDRTSLYGAAMRCAQDGLLPDGYEAAITKFGNTAQYMPMTRGILKKVRNSGELTTINAHVVYSNDKYRAWVDREGEHFEHEKARGDRGTPVCTYAYAITKDGGFYFEEIDEQGIQAIRKVSRAANNGPWAGPFQDEMRRKSAIRRLAKRLPMSTDVEETLRADEELFSPAEPTAGVVPSAPPASTAEAEATGRARPSALDKVVKAGKRRDTSQAEDATARAPAGEQQQGEVSGPPAGHPASDEPPADVI